ncbi:hypothetical protein [Yeosuana sp.]|uniref:hypothetical protein n=1 Tax=Yeosuana sp. TaxID=2529388 RepID=UPI0040551D74
MIKQVVSILGFLLISLHGLSQNTFVPDDNFEQALIDLGYDVGPLDDFVPTTNICGVTSLYVLNLNSLNNLKRTFYSKKVDL